MFVKTSSWRDGANYTICHLERVFGPQSVTRFNLFNSTKITGATNPGFSTGDAIAAVEEVSQSLPSNFSTAYSGLTREEQNAGNQTTVILILVIVFVYFILSAQYESFISCLSR